MSENNATPTIDRKQLANDITAIQKKVMAESSPQDDLRFFKKVEWWGRLCTISGYATAWILPNPISALLISQGIFTRWALLQKTGLQAATQVGSGPCHEQVGDSSA